MSVNNGKTEKIKPRFNIVDFMIITALLLVTATVLFRGTILKWIGNVIYTEDTVLTVLIPGMTADEAAALSEGDLVYLNGEKLGEITAITTVNSTKNVLVGKSTNGLVESQPYFYKAVDEEHFDVTCSVAVKGVYNDDGFYLSGKDYMGVGKTLELHTDRCVCSSIITTIG